MDTIRDKNILNKLWNSGDAPGRYGKLRKCLEILTKEKKL